MAKKQILAHVEWERKLNEVPISRDEMNRLIMDYLVIEGYKNAAEQLAEETGLDPAVDLESIENRMLIRSAIQRGDVEEAIGRVNDLDSEILDTNPLLFFHLKQQRLIELIRAGSIAEALNFAAEELAPRGEERPELLPELERTMALLAFDVPRSTAPAHIAELLAPEQRLKTATELNAAILASQSQGREPKLPQMLAMLRHGEDILSGPGKLNFPPLDLTRRSVARVDAHARTTDGDTLMT